MAENPELSSGYGPRVPVYSATDEGNRLTNGKIRFQNGSIDYTTTVEDAKTRLLSGIYSSLLADFTFLDHTGKELMLWAQTNVPQTAVYYLSRSTSPVIYSEVWNVDANSMFHHSGHQQDSITPLLNTLFTEHPANRWVSSVFGELIKIRRRINNRPGEAVLMTGEAGTAKYALAQISHIRSRRAYKPFVFVNCKYHGTVHAIEWSERERRLFRINIRKIMNMADGGTLYFHEVDHLDISVQDELSGVLRTSLVDSKNGKSLERFSGLVVCSTRRTPEELVLEGECSTALFQTMSANVVRIPSLSDYKDEIGSIAEEMLHNYCVMKRIPCKSFTRDALSVISGHVWNRNVRELYETVIHAVDLCEGRLINTDHILFGNSACSSPQSQGRRCRLRQALIDMRGNRSKAARHLGISRKTLYEWIEEYRIPRNFGKPHISC